MAQIIYALRTRRLLEVIAALQKDPEDEALIQRWDRLTSTPEAFWEFVRLSERWTRVLRTKPKRE